MKEETHSLRCLERPLPNNKSARRATRGCAGCNPSCTARITLPVPEKKPTFARKKRRTSLSSVAILLTAPMKPTQKSPPKLAPLLAFGAHPDDIEFGCGGVIARETQAGRQVHFVVCSRGEAESHGTPRERIAEARRAATLLGATVEFIELDGDVHL